MKHPITQEAIQEILDEKCFIIYEKFTSGKKDHVYDDKLLFWKYQIFDLDDKTYWLDHFEEKIFKTPLFEIKFGGAGAPFSRSKITLYEIPINKKI